ncbi:MAG: hypothetical protein ACUVUA_04975 [Chloroflexus sp.]|uniref:hypothetical protein n=1 Tax=Chloroflexus sp. TaxID=1904827 RepID=UPI0040490784
MYRLPASLVLFTGVILFLVATFSIAQGQPQNLIQDGGFEQGAINWAGCGNVGLVDAQVSGSEFVYAGRYAAALGINADGSDCPQLPNLTTPKQILQQQLSIPANAPAVTVSFWYRAAAGTAVDMFLARGLYQFDPNLGGVKLGSFATDLPPGWQLYRTVLIGENLDRVRGQTLFFSIVIQSDAPTEETAYLLVDDVRVVVADQRTRASPLPPALRGDGSRPLAVIRREGDSRFLYRMDTDGGNRTLLYRGLLNNVRNPVWSPDGQRIAVVDYNTWPWPVPDPDPQNNLPASAITVLNANGGGGQQVFQTQSRKGSRCSFVGVPGQSEVPSQILRVNHLAWLSADQLVFDIVGFNQFCNGQVTGGAANIHVASARSTTTFPPTLAAAAVRPTANRNGRVLFEHFGERTRGIWEVVATSSSPTPELLLPGGRETQPVWSPDGRRFAVVRDTVSPSADASERVTAIMVYDRDNLALPRQVLFADHGRSVRSISWSPNGAYLAYTLEQANDQSDIWWLEIASGATGPITTDGVSFAASWRSVSVLSVYLPMVIR